ncbi:MAG: hypothetical protein P4L99_01350 [Chthoniobacter sp.]|nr:hypothetical protein [Chthoniobacter sp.]
MIAYPITREQTAFPHYEITTSSSHTEHDSSTSADNSAYGYTSIEGGSSITVSQFTNHFTESIATEGFSYNGMHYEEFGATTSANATMFSATLTQQTSSSFSSQQSIGTDGATIEGHSSASSLFTSSTSFTSNISESFGTTAPTGYTSTRATTANYDTTTSYWTVSGAGSTNSLTTSSKSTNVLSVTGMSYSSTSVANVSTSSTYATYIEFGAFISAESEWLWKPLGPNASPHFVSDFAFSFVESSFWPEVISVEATFASVDSDASSSTMEIAAASSSISYQILFNSTTLESTITSGDSFSRTTRTVEVPLWTTSSAGLTIGNEAETITAASTASVSTTTASSFPITYTVLYPYGFFNSSTSEIAGFDSRITTTTQYSIVPGYIDSFSSTSSFGTDGGGATNEGGATQNITEISYRNYAFIGFGGLPNGITPVAPFGAFVAPSDLRSDGNPYNFGSNLSFEGGEVPFPFGAVKNVFSNAQTPFPVATSTTGTNSHTWLFSWYSDTMKVTEQSTSLSGTHTVTHSTVTSGTFSAFGDISSYYADAGTVFGGFPFIESAADSVIFPARAVIGTSISINGDSTTYRSLAMSSSTTELSETVVVENQIPAFYVYTYAAGVQEALPYLEYLRNP